MKKILLSVAFVIAALTSANAQTVLSQTNEQAPDNTAVACAVGNPATGISESAYYRAYTLPSDLTIGVVRLGVGSVTGEFPISVTLYTSDSAFPGSFPDGLTEAASTDIVLTESQSMSLVDIEVSPVAFQSGDVVVVEIYNANTSVGEGGNGSLHYMGTVSSATSPSYLIAPGCGISSPTTFAGISFPDMELIIDLVEVTASTGNFTTSTFSVYPNPTKDIINVANSQDAIESITITDMNGRVVKNVILGVNEGQINISDLSQGVYVLNAVSNGKSFTEKIIKK